MKILESLKSILSSFLGPKKSPEPMQNSFQLGANVDDADYRNIMIHDVVDVALTNTVKEYETDLSMVPVTNQMDKGTCVAQAEGTVAEYYQRIQGYTKTLSRRDLHSQIKKIDQLAVQGTFPKFATQVLINRGIASTDHVPDDNRLPWDEYIYDDFDSSLSATAREEDAKNHRMRNYVQVQPTAESLKAAIINYKIVAATISIDWGAGWITGKTLTTPKNVFGTHRIVLKGFKDGSSLVIKGRNSWDKEWGLNGEFEFNLEDYANNLFDIRAYTAIPDPTIQKSKSMPYIFTQTLKYGSKGTEVFQLQLKLGLKADGNFGSGTRTALITYQKARGLQADGICGKSTQNALNGQNGSISAPTKPTVAMFCDAIKEHEGWYPGSRSFRNNNPGNIEFLNQPNAVLEYPGSNGKARFAKFNTYQDGLDCLISLITRACQGKIRAYNPNMTFVEFFGVYAPSSDGNSPRLYAQFVAQKCGCPMDTKMKELL